MPVTKVLPRLVYIGDVPVESSYHGSALLYRLLCQYPPSRLMIIESGLQYSLRERRLAGVHYRSLPTGWGRWLSTRLHSIVSTCLIATAANRAALLPALLDDFSPQAVLTVGHGYGWQTAARFAAGEKVPLHLIVHDDWPRVAQLGSTAGKWLDGLFGRVYRQAASRMCVSPFMAQEYTQRYAARGTVLYPSRAVNASAYPTYPVRVPIVKTPLVYAFGGSINTPGYVQALNDFSNALSRHGGQLNIYGPLSRLEADHAGLSVANINLCGLLSPQDYVQELRDHVDVLFLPMSFAARDCSNMRLCFPSKLADYTMVGLPLLIYGPEYSAAVRWARAQGQVAEVVTEKTATALSQSVERLQDFGYRRKLGNAAIAAGNIYFGQDRAQRQFYESITIVQDEPALQANTDDF